MSLKVSFFNFTIMHRFPVAVSSSILILNSTWFLGDPRDPGCVCSVMISRFRVWSRCQRLLLFQESMFVRDIGAGDSSTRKVSTSVDVGATAPAPVSGFLGQPTGLPHVTPGLTGNHVLAVDSFTKEQVSFICQSDEHQVFHSGLLGCTKMKKVFFYNGLDNPFSAASIV